jgi:hypothetical protein
MKTYYITTLDLNEHRVTVEYDTELMSEDEGYASISSIWSEDDNCELFEGQITAKSYAKLQQDLDALVMETCHDDYYEMKACRAYDSAKDRMKYGD